MQMIKRVAPWLVAFVVSAFGLAGIAIAGTAWWHGNADWLIGGGTVWLAAATTLLWLYTALMWGATKRVAEDSEAATEAAKRSANAAKETADTMKDTARRQLRAYLAITDKGPHDGAVSEVVASWDGRNTIARLYLKNTGSTPAYKVRISGVVIPGTTGVENHQNKNNKESDSGYLAKIIINPGEYVAFERPMSALFDKPLRDKLAINQMAVYFVGHIDYEDAFGCARYIMYQVAFSGKPGEKTNEIGTPYYFMRRFGWSVLGNDAN